MTDLPEPPALRLASLAGDWRSVARQGPLWPEECWSNDETGSWFLFDRQVLGMRRFPHNVTAYLKIDQFISKLRNKSYEEAPWYEFQLDGRQTPYVPFLRASGAAKWKCTSRSYSEIIGESQLPDEGLVFRWKLQLEEGGKRCKLQVEHLETATVGTHYYERVPPTALPSNQLRLHFVPRQCDAYAPYGSGQALEIVKEQEEVGKVARGCGCFYATRRVEREVSLPASLWFLI
mmetsp:Transcript_52553/g.94332  ORF Transcript_52553/g.94332 Transcript_52553/m.94332 type:complete len:233 (+) Transcript_52553:50-748(+)